MTYTAHVHALGDRYCGEVRGDARLLQACGHQHRIPARAQRCARQLVRLHRDLDEIEADPETQRWFEGARKAGVLRP